ncbi:MAG: DEAD/DEAH box helicase [Candidatus Helarchaeota archaeon]
MSHISNNNRPQNIFLIAEYLQNTYKKFVKTFQKFQNGTIQDWVKHQMETKDLLYKDPIIELNFQFEKGKSLQKLVQEGVLNPQIPSIFKIDPYKHQSEAIEKICRENRNIIVSTGTGSGKSICFWVPIINTCLEMKQKELDGIKAIIIFPMNALANSQYNNIAKLLQGTGLTIGRYTGETAYPEEEGERILKKIYKREKYDCEILSRDKMRENPPDILITNYVMLDLILTRHEDKKLFPEHHRGYLKYIVLDEIHTYSGNKGADVAGLIRRMKHKTQTQGKICCIGTSATIQDNKKVAGAAAIIEFADKIFGEKFDASSLIEASYVNLEIPEEEMLPLPKSVLIQDVDLNEFDGSLNKVIPIAEKLLGRPLEIKERTKKGLGELFHRHPTVIFLRNSLKENAKSLKDLAKEYQKQIREGEPFENCLKELIAGFLLGTVAEITVEGQDRPLVVPKIHLFFTQGHEISSCLTAEGPHPSIDGDLRCKQCESPAFPLYFCRNCGHEFYSVLITEETILPRTYEIEETGELVYLTPITKDNSSWNIPEQWLDKKGKVRKTYADALPLRAKYCPKCNRVDSVCSCAEKIEVWKIPYPFQLCPSCEIFYTKRRGEYSKLFTFNSTGRSTATDILSAEILRLLDKEQKKLIIFTDSRQDTALQAEHMNEFQRRLNFRQIFYHFLQEITVKGLRVTDEDIGQKLFDFLTEKNLVPDYAKREEEEFSSAPPPEREFAEFLGFLALSDIMQSQYFLDLNLEKLGILKIEYDGLDLLSRHHYMTDIPAFNIISEEERYDYLRGILDIFRWNGAIGNLIFNDSVRHYEDWQGKFKEDILFDINKAHWKIFGFCNEGPNVGQKVWFNRQRVVFKKIQGYNTLLANWTKKFFNISDSDQANSLIKQAIDILLKAKFLEEFSTERPTYTLFRIRMGKLLFKLNAENQYLQCPKCNRVYYFKKFHSCIWRNCPDLEKNMVDRTHYYLELYQNLPEKESEIHAREHSAQVEGSLREDFENDFLDSTVGTTNVLVCTPTMELGIDIGDLSAIMMRNVPPDPSRYAQRAGRAGRKNQPSIIMVFCGTGIAKGPHDQYFYRQPERIVSGKIDPPNFLLDNKKLINRHINAAIFENLDLKIPQKLREIVDLTDREHEFPYHPSFREALLRQITGNLPYLESAIKNIFGQELLKFPWFTEDLIHLRVDGFYSNFDQVFNLIREEFVQIFDELAYLYNQSLTQGTDKLTNRKMDALRRKLDDIRNGKRPYFTYNLLSIYGFLPNYAFPSETTHLTMFDSNKVVYRDNWRSSVIAIREFAPHNQIYFLGSKYRVNKAMIKTDRGEINVDKIYICENCNEIVVDSINTSSTSLVKCPTCNEEINLSNYKSSIHFPHMSSISGDRITCDEENRRITGYEITMNYKRNTSNVVSFNFACGDSVTGTLTYEHNGKIYMVNKGSKQRSKTTMEISVNPFNFCSACGTWFHEEAADHVEKCDKKGSERNLYESLWLFVEGNHDVVVFTLPIVGTINEEEIAAYYKTLKEAITQSIILTYNLDESEIYGFINPIPGKEEQAIVIFETEEGGAGILKSLLDPTITRFDKFVENLINVVHIESLDPYQETKEACIAACYNCLLSFRNQFEHKFLDRKLILPLIRKLYNCNLSESGTLSSEERLEQLKSQCDSELEKMVLDEIHKQDLPLPTAAQKHFYDDGVPIVIADFFYEPATCVFVDGPPHIPENVQKEDAQKRDFLESKGQVVVALDFKDGKYKEDPTLIEKEVQKLKDFLII